MDIGVSSRTKRTRMALDPISASFENCVPPEWLLYLRDLDLPVDLPLDGFEQPLFSQAFERALPSPPPDPVYGDAFFMDVQPNAQPTDINERSEIPLVAPLVPPPVILPPTSPPPPQRYRKIQRRPYKKKQRNYTPSQPILFPVNGFPGMNMGSALRKNFMGLEGRDDLVMEGIGKTAFTSRFLFAGYPAKFYQVEMVASVKIRVLTVTKIFTRYWNRTNNPIERSKLAHEVAKRLKVHLDSVVPHVMDPAAHRKWRIGEGFVRLDNIFLARLESVSRGSYQPVFYVVEPTLDEPHAN